MEVNEFKIILDFAHIYIDVIAKKVVRDLKTLKDKDFLLSGDDSGLENVWDEICVQMQGEQSFHWSIYEDLIEKVVYEEMKKHDYPIINAINYIGYIALEREDNQIGIDCGMNEIKSKILTWASDYTNKKIVKFLDSEWDIEE